MKFILNVCLILEYFIYVCKKISKKIFFKCLSIFNHTNIIDMNIKEVRKQLPNGAGREIAKMSGVNYGTVQRFLRGAETKENIKLMGFTAEYLKQYKESKNKALEKLQAIANA
ncbi:hypothetical protein BWK63_04975 [Flavobacterium covae]|uniref:hypothetical protein n=1 Tax=Flavobacterium covae TaxID=2906076 RepID=UPI000B4CF663|nr:hypothetical protein [Flavobacterium covae]OWP81639.1 hypothetical protein BWK63_04975 [Flavobacterium covae]